MRFGRMWRENEFVKSYSITRSTPLICDKGKWGVALGGAMVEFII